MVKGRPFTRSLLEDIPIELQHLADTRSMSRAYFFSIFETTPDFQYLDQTSISFPQDLEDMFKRHLGELIRRGE